MNEYQKEYNERQIELMKTKIQSYLDNKLAFHHLINDLEALLNCMESLDQEWESKFRGAWGNLEDTYAFALHEGKKLFDEEDKKLIEENLEKILSLLNNFSGRYSKQ